MGESSKLNHVHVGDKEVLTNKEKDGGDGGEDNIDIPQFSSLPKSSALFFVVVFFFNINHCCHCNHFCYYNLQGPVQNESVEPFF